MCRSYHSVSSARKGLVWAMVHSRWNNIRINVENLIKCLVLISELPCVHYEKGGWQSTSDAGAPDAIDAGKCLWCHGSCVSSWHDSSTWQTWHCHMLHHISSVSHYSEHVMRGLKSWGGVRIVNGLSYVIPAQSCLSQRVRDKTNSVLERSEVWGQSFF